MMKECNYIVWEFNLNVKMILTFNTKKVTKEKITFSLFHEIVCMDEVIWFIIESLRKTKTCLKSNYTHQRNLINLNIL